MENVQDQPSSADGQPTPMSLIPYQDNHEIVLRSNNALVTRNISTKHVTVHGSHSKDDTQVGQQACPTCRRPFETADDIDEGRISEAQNHVEPGFIAPGYFRMLEANFDTENEGPASPTLPESRNRRLPRRGQLDYRASTTPDRERRTSSTGISSAAFLKDYFNNVFREVGVLGKGGKGVVLLVDHVLDGVELGKYACKRVPVGNNHDWLKEVLLEVTHASNLSHPNLVSYQHVWLEKSRTTPFGPRVPCAFILQQYCNGGDLQQYICGGMSEASSPTVEVQKERLRRRRHSKDMADPSELHGPKLLDLDVIYHFFKDIVAGLEHLHAKGYIHRDLKPSNCLLHQEDSNFRVLISDFGEIALADMARSSTGATGTISHCAPEVLAQGPDGKYGEFTFKSDIFALGLVLYFMCFGRLPYNSADIVHEENEDIDELRAEITAWSGFSDDQRNLRTDLPEALYNFLKRLLAIDPNQRPTAEQVLHAVNTGTNLQEAGKTSRHTTPSTGTVFDPETGTGVPRISPIETSPAPAQRPQPRNRSGSIRPRQPSNIRTAFASDRRSSGEISPLLTSSDPPLQPETAVMRRPNSYQPPAVEGEATRFDLLPASSPSQTSAAKTNKLLPDAPVSASVSVSEASTPPLQLHHKNNRAIVLAKPLPPPPPSPLIQLTHSFRPYLKILILLAKVYSVTYPCAYGTTQPLLWTAISFGVLDFILPDFVGVERRWMVGVALLGVHVALVWAARLGGWTCY